MEIKRNESQQSNDYEVKMKSCTISNINGGMGAIMQSLVGVNNI